MRRAVALLAVLCACNSDKATPTDTDADTDDPFDNPTADTSIDPVVDLTGLAGSVALVHWASDPYNAGEYFAVGLFVDDDLGIDNLAACLFAGGKCIDEYPTVGGAGAESVPSTIYTDATYDVGDVMMGEVLLQPEPSAGFPLYLGDATSLGGPGGLSLDGDFAPYAGTADYIVPDEIVVTSPDTSVLIEAVPGGSIDLEWASPGAGAVYLEVLSGLAPLTPDTVVQLDDDGSHTLDIDAMQFREPYETKVVLLSRIENSEVDASGNTIQLQARSDQWLYVSFTQTVGWTELSADVTLGDSCDDALTLPSVGPGQYYGDLTALSNDHDLGDDNPLTGFATAGLDGVVPVTLTAGQVLTATYLQSFDASIYVLDSGCAVADALEGADLTLDGEEEELTFTAPADGTYYLVVDAWAADSGGPFTLVLGIQ